MTSRERIENRIARREAWAASRAAKADQEFKKADMSESATGIPFGQPILVGHHSEGRHRRTIERAHNAMRRSIESADIAKNHASKAANLRRSLRSSIFSDDPDAIARLKEKIVALERQRKFNTSANKIIRSAPRNEFTESKKSKLIELGLSPDNTAEIAELFKPDYMGRVGVPSFVNANLSTRLQSAKKRLASIRAQQARAQQAEESGGVSVVSGHGFSIITFSEKPDRAILAALKAAGFRWSSGSWRGPTSKIPECINQ
jgi:hypothetical protein